MIQDISLKIPMIELYSSCRVLTGAKYGIFSVHHFDLGIDIFNIGKILSNQALPEILNFAGARKSSKRSCVYRRILLALVSATLSIAQSKSRLPL